jgi:hypothetical protein
MIFRKDAPPDDSGWAIREAAGRLREARWQHTWRRT